MKIRNGFVSNSSSSSFIVIFPRAPTSAEDLHELLFGKSHLVIDAYADDVCSHIFIRGIWEAVVAQQEQPERCAEQLAYEVETLKNEMEYFSKAKSAARATYFQQHKDDLASVLQALEANDGSKIYVFTYDEGEYMGRGDQFEHPDRQVKSVRLYHG